MEIHTITTIDAPPDRVWDVLTDGAGWDRWNPMIRGLRGRLAEGETIRFGLRLSRTMSAPISAEVLTVRPERSLRWVGPAPRLARRVVSGEHYFELAELGGKTRFEHGESFRGLLVPARAERVASAMRKVYERFNEALARECVTRS